jgi:kinesin family protein 15
MCRLLARGQAARRVGETAMNRESSRSHSVLTCTLEAAATDSRGVTSVLRSRLNLVDLAGAPFTPAHWQITGRIRANYTANDLLLL